MSEASDILDAVKGQIEDYSSLNYIRSFTKFKDELELEEAGEYPFINFDVRDMMIKEADNMNLRHMERRWYPIIITFAVRGDTKQEVIEGDLGTKGLWNIYDDIGAAIRQDLSFGYTVKRGPFRPEISTDIVKYPDGSYYVGRAAMIFEVYKDVSIV